MRKLFTSVDETIWPEVEFILIDDATPISPSALWSECPPGLLFRIIRQERNTGPGIARNTGLQNANGTFVVFLDADDEPDISEFIVMCHRMRHDGILIAALSYQIFHRPSGRLASSRLPEGWVSATSLLEVYPAIWRYIFNRRWLVESGIRFVSLRYAEDLLFLVDVLEANPSVLGTKRVGYTHFVDDEGASLSSQRLSNEAVRRALHLLAERRSRLGDSALRGTITAWMWRIWLRNVRRISDPESFVLLGSFPRAIPSRRSTRLLVERMLVQRRWGRPRSG